MKCINALKISLLLAVILFPASILANVTFQFSPGTVQGNYFSISKASVEKNISALLTEINRAGNAGTKLNLAGINIEPEAASHLNNFWNEASHYICVINDNVNKCLKDYQGFQVRGIPILMKPVDSNYDQSLDRELTISFNKKGIITGVRPAWEVQEDVSKILANPNGVDDTEKRMEILKWVEDFRCYYNEKNIKSLENIFSDDALIITGSVVKRKKGGDGVRLEDHVVYTVKDKDQYIKSLISNFARNKYINVEFDHISVVCHPAKENIYGVTLHQKWQSSTYKDEGWVFLLWDFNDPVSPQIHVRTWQPDQIVAKNGKIGINDFFIP